MKYFRAVILAAALLCLAPPIVAMAECKPESSMVHIAGQLREAGVEHAMLTGDSYDRFMVALTAASRVEPPDANGLLIVSVPGTDTVAIALFNDDCFVAVARIPLAAFRAIMGAA